MIRAGTLKHKIVIQSFSSTINEYREEIKSWSDYLTTKASIKPLKGTETYYSTQLHATATHLITFRFQEQITPVMRVKFNDRIFKITSVINVDELSHTTQLIVEEVLDDNG